MITADGVGGLNGEANLQFDGTTLEHGKDAITNYGFTSLHTAKGSQTEFLDKLGSANLNYLGNNYYTGETMIGYADATVVAGQLVVMDGHATGDTNLATWKLASAASGTAYAGNMLGIALSDASSGAYFLVLLRGFVSINTGTYFDFSTGDRGTPAYMSTTAGNVTTTAPTGTGDFVRIVGYQVTLDKPTLRFWPSDEWYQL